MNTDDEHGNLSYFPREKWRREHAEDERAGAEEEPQVSGEVLLKTLEEPFESAGRSRRIARLREKIRAGRYHVSSLELAERLIAGDAF